MGHQQRAQLGPLLFHWYLCHIDEADFWSMLPFPRRGPYESRHYVTSLCLSYAIFPPTVIDKRECVPEHRHPGHNKVYLGLAQPTRQSTIQRGIQSAFQSNINKSAFLYAPTPDPDPDPESDRLANVRERALSQTAPITASRNLSPIHPWLERVFYFFLQTIKRTYTTSLEMIQETIALRKATGRAVCGEESSSEWQARLSGCVWTHAHGRRRDEG